MFLQPAYAESMSVKDIAANFGSLWVFVAVALIMYFMIIRPQRLQVKKRELMLSSIQRGDNIITAGGIIAKVKRAVDDRDELEIEIAEGVVIRVLRTTISEVLPR
ncbi:preprotein translocase subunit YajC [Bartonella sp. TP]|uniref:preprotein translocase subunit YajC n=1 Tax=Bartonella sp. TP TaxID=3057550 RepID=UPI0025AEE3B4|nr:preprotein translocase subunit YajC [Bartonella sp. TP]MDN5249510.1 preprotein translocase subunit YajC [Alphaproteobacteria bacterium]WJW80103.1 preprotein translocase subunit YajC [Bartonella sp. TP]